MQRRGFITLLGGAAAGWPLVARGQQAALPIIGFVRNTTSDTSKDLVAAFEEGLKERSYVAGLNVKLEFRWGDNKQAQLGAMLDDLVEHRVAVIVAGGNDVAVVAKKTSTKIPVVFAIGLDPVRLGLVASLNQPAGNMTGVTFFHTALLAKRVQLLNEVIPNVGTFGFLTDSNNPNSELEVKEAQAAAGALGKEMRVVRVASVDDFESAFTTLAQDQTGGLIIGGSALFLSSRKQLIALAARFAVPAIYPIREGVIDGGLIGYGTSISAAYRQVGGYVVQILRGNKPADLPVQESTKVELVINMKTAKALGVTFPIPLLGRADEVIE